MAKCIAIDSDECTGRMTCINLCRGVFEFDENSESVHVIDSEAEDGCIQ